MAHPQSSLPTQTVPATPYRLDPFDDEALPLHAFYYDYQGEKSLVTTREDFIPDKFDRVSLDHDPLPPLGVPSPAWNREGYEYHAFLPKDREAMLNRHLFSCLHDTRVVTSGGMVRLDDTTKNIWLSLEQGLTWSIECLLVGALVSLEDSAPPLAQKYGYSRPHKTLKTLNFCLRLSRNAFLLRFAYLSYIYTIRKNTFEDSIPPWVDQLTKLSHHTFVDSLWEAIRWQRSKREYIGTLVLPKGHSIRWIKAAAAVGVPIWVLWQQEADYQLLEGGHVVKAWAPNHDLIAAAAAPPPVPPTVEPQDTPPLPPPQTMTLPPGSTFIVDPEEFFRKRNEADVAAAATATLSEKQQWENRQQAAARYQQPGRKGPRVYTWREGEAGGYIRELVDRGDVGVVWEDCPRQQMFFHPRSNVWDLCAILGDPEDDSDPNFDGLDAAEEQIGEVQDQWISALEVPAPPPDTDLSELTFLYRRYGFLTVEPTTTGATPKWPFTKVRRIPGLTPKGDDNRLEDLAGFISIILQRRLPGGHCDFSADSPDNERFAPPTGGVINHITPVSVPELGNALFYMLNPPDGRIRLLVHDPLTIAEMGRMQVQLGSAPVIDYLLRNGSKFTVLAGQTEDIDPTNLHILPFSARPQGWVATVTDFHFYMSMLRLLFRDRPYVAAAALARGGIAWRITREVLGLDIDLILNGPVFTDMARSAEVLGSTQWSHAVDEGEWYYLVGGYCILTGLFFCPNPCSACANALLQERVTKPQIFLGGQRLIRGMDVT